MIEINLLPEELKAKAAKSDLNFKYYLLIIPPVLAILFLFHLGFFTNGLIKQTQLNSLNKKWKLLEPQIKNLEGSRQAKGASAEDAELLRTLLPVRILWAEKLHKLSAYLPPGVWFTSASISSAELSLRGTVYSATKEEMVLINKFMVSLKKDKGFFEQFSNLELSSVQKSMKGTYETIDFVITGVLKASKEKTK